MFAPLIHFWPGLSDPPAAAVAFARCPGPPHYDSRSLGIATTSVPDVHLALDPTRQRWSQLPDGHWLGVALEPLPDPDLFLRPDALPGIPVLLGDRQLWRLPRVNPGVAHDLPTQRRLADLPAPVPAAGSTPLRRAHTVLEVLPAYADVTAQARHLADLAVAAVLLDHAAALPVPDADLVQFITTVIALNYALTPDEILALGLLAPDTDAPALLAVIGFPAAIAAVAAHGPPQQPRAPAAAEVLAHG